MCLSDLISVIIPVYNVEKFLMRCYGVYQKNLFEDLK